jgi:integrase/recombinase XerD
MEVTQAINAFLTHCKVEKNLSPKTLKAYGIDLNQFSLFLREKNIAEVTNITKGEIKEYAGCLTAFSPSTMRRKIATLKAFFNHHEFEENIAASPLRKVKLSVKLPKALPKVMNLPQVEKILSAAYKEQQELRKNSFAYKRAVRNVAVLELLFATGIRVAELCSLTVDSVSADFSLIAVVGKGSRERRIPIANQAVRAALMLYHKCFKNEVAASFFVNRLHHRLSEQSVRHMVAYYARKAKISQRITPHVFRHTFATLLLEKDVDIRYIQHILGHSSISVTQLYTHVNDKKKYEILCVKHPRNEVVV